MFYKDFTVSFFLKMIRKRIKFIVLLTLVGGILTLLYANFFITPSYSAQAMVIVQNYTAADAAADAAEEAAQNGVTDKSQQEDIQDTTNAKSFNDGNVKIYASDLTASSTLAQYCTILFKNNVEIQNMLNGCGMEITQEQESNFLWITMTSSNPKTAADTCNAVVNKILDLLGVDNGETDENEEMLDNEYSYSYEPDEEVQEEFRFRRAEAQHRYAGCRQHRPRLRHDLRQ